MSSSAAQIKSIILKHQGGASKQQLARELNFGLEYIGFICRELERKGELTLRKGYYLLTISKKALRQRIIPIKKHKPKKGAQNTFLGMPKMTERLIDILNKAGYKTIESLADAPPARFMQETKLELHEAAGLINQARKALNKIGE